MRFSFLSSFAVLIVSLPVACSSSIATGGSGGSGGGATSATTTSSATSSGTGGAACTPPSSPAVFETGTGEACFERLASGATVKVLQGPQGGFHIWLAVGCSDCGTKATIEYGVKNPATMAWYDGTYAQKVVVPLTGSPWGQQAGFTAFLPGVVWDATTQLPKGTHVLLSATVLGPDDGALHQAEVDVVLGDVEEYNPPCDQNPMTCGQPGSAPCCGLNG